MKKYPQLQSLKEAKLLIGTKQVFGIYQIRDDSAGTAYAFRNMNFIESHDLQVQKEDYKLVQVGELQEDISLEEIFEQFNIHRPEDFRGTFIVSERYCGLEQRGKGDSSFCGQHQFPEIG